MCNNPVTIDTTNPIDENTASSILFGLDAMTLTIVCLGSLVFILLITTTVCACKAKSGRIHAIVLTTAGAPVETGFPAVLAPDGDSSV